MRWDPVVYARYDHERARPFFDLVARVVCAAPRRVVDLGCGSGVLTASLAARWPSAQVAGVDSSPEMVAAAPPGVSVAIGSIESWQYPADADVVVSNAALQWVPGHLDLLASWTSSVPPGGWLAWQVPGNFANPAHTLLRTLASSWGVGEVLRHHDAVAEPSVYAALLLDGGLAADVWETTYLHVLQGPDPVLTWMRGTGLRPVLGALPEPEEFLAEYGELLRSAYPTRPGGTVFAFRRVFAVGHRP